MTRYDFTKAMSKYAKRDRQNRKDGYSISLFQNDNGIITLRMVYERPLMKALSCNLNIDLSKYDPNAEVDSEYIAMLSKMMALLRQKVVETNFEVKAQAESLKAKKFARHFGRKVTISITHLMKELDLLSHKENGVAE
jgi:hypothetical protein